jgi:hypothetical protein
MHRYWNEYCLLLNEYFLTARRSASRRGVMRALAVQAMWHLIED